jgi:hypothetical protein
MGYNIKTDFRDMKCEGVNFVTSVKMAVNFRSI